MLYLRSLLAVATLFACVAGFGGLVAAQESVELPAFSIVASADGIEFPAELPEGLVHLTFENQSEAPIMPVPARLLEDVTMDQLMETMMNAGPMAGLSLVALQGGTMVLPESSVEIVYDLLPGPYVVFDFAAEEPAIYTFVVEDAAGTGAEIELEADLKVALVDFAFAIPQEIPAGEQQWLIENIGGQWHELIIERVEDGTTLAQAREMMAEAEGGPGGPLPTFLWMPMAEGTQALVSLNLEPGTYIVACLLPDVMADQAEEMHTHANLGMVQVITVQ